MKPTPLAFLALLSACLPAAAEVRLPKIFGSHMVLQRDAPLRVWGTAEAGEKVVVTLAGRSFDTAAKEDGTWMVSLPPLKAGGGQAHKMIVKGTNQIVLEDLLIGDVWIGSGQSNMEWQLRSTERGQEFIAAADHPKIRLFHIPKVQKDQARHRCQRDQWKVCTPAHTCRTSRPCSITSDKKIHEQVERPGRIDQQLLGRIADRAVDRHRPGAPARCTTA